MGKNDHPQVTFYTELLINDQLVKGAGIGEPILNPATGEVLCTVPEASPE